MREAPGPDEPFAAAVYYRLRRVGIRGELAVLEVIPGGEGRVTLSDPAGRGRFSHPPSELQVTIASKITFRVQHGDERWCGVWIAALHRAGAQTE